MTSADKVLVFGATGNLGGALARELLERGRPVRAVTRSPESEKAVHLARLGAEVVRADMDDRDSLEAVFDGIKKVFSVQNWMISGADGEVRQGRLVAEAAAIAGVDHLVYASAGVGEPGSGLPHFDSKLEVEAYMRNLDLPFTVIRPGPFMELMTDKSFFPQMAVWGAEPKVVGWDTPKPWTAVRDVGKAAANILADPDTWIGREVLLVGDVKSLAQCRAAYIRAAGRKPFGIPVPLALLRRMAGEEIILMWQWIGNYGRETGEGKLRRMVEASRALVPDLLDVENWLRLKLASQKQAVGQHQSRAY